MFNIMFTCLKLFKNFYFGQYLGNVKIVIKN